MKKWTILLCSLILSVSCTIPAFASGWVYINNIGWFYDQASVTSSGPGGSSSSGTSRYAKNIWLWIPDGSNQRVMYCYYFGPDGRMYQNQVTPDGYTVDASGAWTIDGVKQWKLNENYKDTTIQIQTKTTIPDPAQPYYPSAPRPRNEPKVYRDTPSIRDEFYPVYSTRDQIREQRK